MVKKPRLALLAKDHRDSGRRRYCMDCVSSICYKLHELMNIIIRIHTKTDATARWWHQSVHNTIRFYNVFMCGVFDHYDVDVDDTVRSRRTSDRSGRAFRDLLYLATAATSINIARKVVAINRHNSYNYHHQMYSWNRAIRETSNDAKTCEQ